MYIIYIRVRCYFSLMCTSKNAMKFYEVIVDVQKGP